MLDDVSTPRHTPIPGFGHLIIASTDNGTCAIALSYPWLPTD